MLSFNGDPSERPLYCKWFDPVKTIGVESQSAFMMCFKTSTLIRIPPSNHINTHTLSVMKPILGVVFMLTRFS